MYHYDTLGHERFQELCQALISVDFPSAQCLPVGQPDGGRDAYLHLLSFSDLSHLSELVVFQVKYSKNPNGDRSERDAIAELVRTEKRKIDQLKARGLKKYIFITNVKGTAHLDVGSIDTVNEELSKLLGVEALCWWQDDLDRRLDAASDVKWSYPEVIKATDLLQVLVQGQLGEHEERRRNAIRAYLTVQYEEDLELKFKQTDLRSKMTSLFVDLPISQIVHGYHDDVIVQPSITPFYSGFKRNFLHYREINHAAEFLLNAMPQKRSSRILIEGAPGQGKSTVTQYVCQVMRMLVLNKRKELSDLEHNGRGISARLPFRVDLRDLAKWLAGTDPFQSKLVSLADHEPKSLEGFISAQVRNASGGASFDVSDVQAVAKAGHIFLALDGFDEVADAEMRNTLVTEISKATSRLSNLGSFTVQTVVTSRPAAFAKSVRFPREHWSYYQLLPLERTHVDAYTEKWMRAKGLKSGECDGITKVLNEKLEEAHTQYLAKNPMQLTILLSLINNRGSSLPEKRTAMYDAYMDMFFSRESEKSEIVRDNRDLLVDIHRYLAWVLQTGAEGGGDGSIEYSELRLELFRYLDSQGEDTSIIDGLFDGIIERVGALVSRVQETFEFEVQPLREYFAARHLYDTAPYSTIADEQKGTKLDRFRALVYNPYWLNATRFYGGCFSKGEVSALVDELKLLTSEGSYVKTSLPRIVALMFLSDWVFSQYQPAVKRVVELICAKPQLRQLLAAEQSGELNWARLPARSGKKEFVSRLWEHFIASQFSDEQRALAFALRQSTSETELVNLWVGLRGSIDEKEWISKGSMLNIFHAKEIDINSFILNSLPSFVVKELLIACRFDILNFDEVNYVNFYKEVLKVTYINIFKLRICPFLDSKLFYMAKILNSDQYHLVFNDEYKANLLHLIEMNFPGGYSNWCGMQNSKGATQTKGVFDAYQAFLKAPCSDLSTSSALWVELVETLRSELGDCNAIDHIAIIAAGIRVRGEIGDDQPLLSTTNLVGSVRYARMKSGAPKWWSQKLTELKDSPDLPRYLLILWTWATPRTLFSLAKELDCIMCSLSSEEWKQFWQDYVQCRRGYQRKNKIRQLEKNELSSFLQLGSRTATLLGEYLRGEVRYQVVKPVLNDKTSSAPELNFALGAVYRSLQVDPDWKPMLDDVRALYSRGAYVAIRPRTEEWHMPLAVATQILDDLESYPLVLIGIADTVVRAQAGEAIPNLLDTAKKEKWFD